MVNHGDPKLIEMNVFRKVYIMHNHDVRIPSYKDYGRRFFLIFFEELPSIEDLHALAQEIVDHINDCVHINDKQTVEDPVMEEFLVGADKALVEVLGNNQTCALAQEMFGPCNLNQCFADNPAVLSGFWNHGTMSIRIAREFNLGTEWVKSSELEGQEPIAAIVLPHFMRPPPFPPKLIHPSTLVLSCQSASDKFS